MTVEEILTPIITQEFAKYERAGYKIKLRSVTTNRLKYTAYCALGGMFFWPIWPVALIVYIILMVKTNNINTIISVAKKQPNTPIELIVAQEIKR